MLSMSIGILSVVAFAAVIVAFRPKQAEERPAERERLSNLRNHGPINGAVVCPHCQTRGQVHTQMVSKKRGISGGKATAALLTGGVSMLATGLARKERVTEAFCGHCHSTWIF